MNNVMEELLANSSFAELKQGSIIKGKIIEIRQNEVVVDIGGKSEGVVSKFCWKNSKTAKAIP